MDLVNLTWVEVKEYLKKRREVLLPLGSVEEHGYHLPLSTDGDIALAVCQRLGEETGILVAPVIWYGVSNTTRGYKGTVMTGYSDFMGYVWGVLEGLKESGFKTAYMVSGHFSNSHIAAIKEAAQGIKGLKAILLDFSKIDFSDILETMPLHACEAETSLMLYLHPEKVDMGKAVDEEIVIEGGLKKTKSGVFGTPTKATKEKGRLLLDRIVKELRAKL
jgi:creatinine amidohydrolase